jgi:5'(3')-deoxyribonucleotidase
MKSPTAQPNPLSAKPVLAIDIDDVLSEHYGILIDYFNLVYGLKLDHERLHHGILREVMVDVDLPREQIVEETERFLNSPGFNPHPLPHAIDVITKLKPRYHLVIVTARGDFIEEKTRGWLKQHFAEAFSNVEFVGTIGWGRGMDVGKTDKLQQLDANILIDDNLRHCTEAAALGVKAVLFGEYSWNRSETLPGGVTRAQDWLEVEKLLDHD